MHSFDCFIPCAIRYEKDIPGCCVGSCGDKVKGGNSRWVTGVSSDVTKRVTHGTEVLAEKRALIKEGVDKNTKLADSKKAQAAFDAKEKKKQAAIGGGAYPSAM